MPTYDEITPEILSQWKTYLENLTESLLKDLNKYVLRLFIISLYEYIVVKTAYLNHIQHDPTRQSGVIYDTSSNHLKDIVDD